jgi:uncharacterized membrane protein
MSQTSPWRFGVFYYDRDNERLMVPKRLPSLGWTINFGHPRAWWVLVAAIVVIAFVIVGSTTH